MELQLDSLQRRRRDARPHPTGANLEFVQRDIEVLKLLSRYRYLNSDVLHAFAGGNRTRFSKRLRELYDAGYIERPSWQWHTLNANCNPVVYELSAKGYSLLRSRGYDVAKSREGNLHWHEFMLCDIVASIEAFCKTSADLRFIPWHEIYEYEDFPEATRKKQHPMELPASYSHTFKTGRQEGHKAITPDAVFGIEYAKSEYKFFALEADRNTEPAHRNNLYQTSWTRKFLQYQSVMHNRTYLNEWGVPNLLILTVTNDFDQYERIVHELKDLQGKANYHLFKYLPDYGQREGSTLDHLLNAWDRVGAEPLHIWQP